MTREGKEKLTVGIVTALITGGLAVAVALLTKPPVTNIVLPGGQIVNADEILALQSENAALRESLAERMNAVLEETLPSATTGSTTTKAPTPVSVKQAEGDALFSLVPESQKFWAVNYGSAKDASRITYSANNYVNSGTSDGSNGSADYTINKKYSKLSGTICSGEYIGGKELDLTIWLDGRFVYVSPKISKTSEPFYFEMNIEGTNVISFATTGHLLLLDFILS